MKMTLEKLEAAWRQIDTAIMLWFNDGDPVSIHTLACSAYQIVHDVNRKVGGHELLYDSLIIKDEYRKEWIQTLKNPYNFLKHAKSDPFASILFDPEANETFIAFTCFGLEILGVKSNAVRGGFLLRLKLSKPERLTEKGRAEMDKVPESLKQQALSAPKSVFFQAHVLLNSATKE